MRKYELSQIQTELITEIFLMILKGSDLDRVVIIFFAIKNTLNDSASMNSPRFKLNYQKYNRVVIIYFFLIKNTLKSTQVRTLSDSN